MTELKVSIMGRLCILFIVVDCKTKNCRADHVLRLRPSLHVFCNFSAMLRRSLRT